MKRMMLDMIRGGKIDDAERVFNAMEDLFAQLYPFVAFDKVLKEARRKLDVNRMILESSRTVHDRGDTICQGTKKQVILCGRWDSNPRPDS